MRKLFTMTGIGMLSILMGIPALVWAQDEAKPPRQEEPKPEPRQEPRPEARPQPDARQQEEKPPKQEETKPPKHEDKRPEQAQQPERMQQPEQQHAARPANGRGGHIPDDKFRSHFGREHTVVIHQPVVVEGQPRFQYGGYWFAIVDPWPAEWAYTDDCYIDYVDGEYFLFDLLHPGVRVALFVVM